MLFFYKDDFGIWIIHEVWYAKETENFNLNNNYNPIKLYCLKLKT